MTLSRPIKILLLALTLWVPIYMVGFMAMMFSPGMMENFDVLFRVHMATMGIQALLLLVYVVHLFKASTVERDKRALWGISLFCGAPIAMPIYWFTHIWPERPAAVAAASATP
jgi:uncharacterized membrane protein